MSTIQGGQCKRCSGKCKPTNEEGLCKDCIETLKYIKYYNGGNMATDFECRRLLRNLIWELNKRESTPTGRMYELRQEACALVDTVPVEKDRDWRNAFADFRNTIMAVPERYTPGRFLLEPKRYATSPALIVKDCQDSNFLKTLSAFCCAKGEIIATAEGTLYCSNATYREALEFIHVYNQD
jgi:hypothetical protein